MAFDYLGCFGTDNVFDDEQSCSAICARNDASGSSAGVIKPRLGQGQGDGGVCEDREDDNNCTTTPDNKVQ